jgi:hypothetical protein
MNLQTSHDFSVTANAKRDELAKIQSLETA